MFITRQKFLLVGISPLLQHNPAAMKRKSDTISRKEIPTPETEAKAAEYRDSDGDLCVHTIAIRASLAAGTLGKRLGKMGLKRLITAGVFPTTETVKIIHPTTRKPIKTSEVFTCRAVVQHQGILRSRPKIFPWAVECEMEVDSDFISVNQVLDVFVLSGRLAGLGDWRPERCGMFGRYRCELAK